MVSKERKNRPKKKEKSVEKWEEEFENLKKRYEHGGQDKNKKD
jgi:hypothetical protein